MPATAAKPAATAARPAAVATVRLYQVGACERPIPCYRVHRDDLTRFCEPCAAEYLEDLSGGDDWMGGIDDDGGPVRGFAGHAESLEVADDYLAALAR